jgi:hypothetical protein
MLKLPDITLHATRRTITAHNVDHFKRDQNLSLSSVIAPLNNPNLPVSHQHNIVLFLPHRALALQRHRFADELTQARQMLAFFIQKQLNDFG